MKLLLLCLLLFACSNFKDLDVEDSYPISREYQLAARQGSWNSVSTEFDFKVPNFSKKDENINQKPVETAQKDSTCDLFSVALDYISQKYPIKQVELNDGFIITENFVDDSSKQSQITIFAKSLDSLKVNVVQNAKLAEEIKQDIVLNCKH